MKLSPKLVIRSSKVKVLALGELNIIEASWKEKLHLIQKAYTGKKAVQLFSEKERQKRKKYVT